VIYHFKVANAVPKDGSASYAEIACATDLPEPLVFRFVRHAMSNGIFDETPEGKVRHTPTSELLATDQSVTDYVGFFIEELSWASNNYVDAIKQYGASQEPTESPFSMANGSKAPLFEILKHHPERARRFVGTMQHLSSTDASNVRHVFSGFDWASVDRPGAVMVDVGGGHGQVCKYLAGVTEHLKFEVWELPYVVEKAKANASPEFAERVDFVAHDFLTPHSGPPVDVIFIRWTLHNWSDKYVLLILRNLVPVLKNGSRVLIMDYILDEKPVKDVSGKPALNMDLVMGVLLNSRERTTNDFLKLFSTVDKRFVYKGTKHPKASNLSVLEMAWESE